MIQPHELIVDNFAGGGGASSGIELALGRSPDIAVNHDPEAVAMHAANHPATHHYCESVWKVDPVAACAGRPVGLAWFSPDCKHFSKAKGGKPVEKKIRGLAWVVVRWAKAVRPRVIVLENVEEFQTWGPLGEDDRPCPVRKGFTFRKWKAQLERLGYVVELREFRACDYGAPTSRKRLFVIARCDGVRIAWPGPTHGVGRIPYRTAADCIDWSIPCPSIFERDRPLAENTLRRIARGIRRYVIESASPFIVGVGGRMGQSPERSVTRPAQTITSKADSALVVPTLVQTGYGERVGQAPRSLDLHAPLGTIVGCGQKHALVSAFLAKHYGGEHASGAPKCSGGSDLRAPVGTVTVRDHNALVNAHLVQMNGSMDDRQVSGQELARPLGTVTAGGFHFAEVRAFLLAYYGTDQDAQLGLPMPTVTTHDRFGIVMVDGQAYAIADIGMRMLQPRELARAQGFPDSYIIAPTFDGAPLTKTAQVRMIGNSVCPPIAAAIVRANCGEQRQAVAA